MAMRTSKVWKLLAALLLAGGPPALEAAPGSSPSADFAAVPLPTGIPTDQVLLEVRGVTSGGGTLYFDLPSLLAFPSESFEDVDPWDGQRHRWEGVSLWKFLERLGLTDRAESIELLAVNNYRSAIRMSDLKRGRYLIAWSMDGELLKDRAVRPRRGPLQVAINFSGPGGLAVDVYRHQLVWQLTTIAVR